MAFDSAKVDWSSLSQTTGGEIDQSLDDNLEFTMSEAVKIDPDKHSRSMDLSKKSGVPALSITPNLESIEKEVKVNEFDFSSLRNNSPKTANYIVSPDNAVIAQDDIPVMESIESLLNFDVTDLNRSITEFGQETTAYGEDIGQGFERGQLTVESADIGRSRMFDALSGKFETTQDQISRLSEIEGKLKPQDDDYGFFAGAPIAAAEQLPIMGEILGTGLAYAAGGAIAGAITRTGAFPAAKIAGRVGVAKAAFDLESGLAFNEYSVFTGDDGELINQKTAAGAAIVVGGINAALEFVSLVALGRTVTPAMKALVRSKVKQSLGTESGRQMLTRLMGRYAQAVAAETITEGMQEFVTVIGGEISKYMNEDNFSELYLAEALDNIFSEKTAERVGEGMKKAAQASMVLSSPGTIASIAVENNQRKALAENEQKRIDKLNDNFGESNLKGRNKEKFKEFVEQADGENNTTVFMDGSQVSLYLQDISLEEIEADQGLSLLASQVREAAALGVDVQIPVADFATDIAGTAHYDALRESMTISEDGISPFRQNQIDEDNRTYIQTLMDDMKESSDRNIEHAEALEQVKDQLVDTGRLSSQEASVAAQVVPAWADAKAKKTGKSIKEVYEESGLIIKGPLTGEKARLESEKALLQAKDSGYKGDINLEAAEYNQAVAKGLDMSQEAIMQRASDMGFDTDTVYYHGTTADFKEFKGGITFLADSPVIAEIYAKSGLSTGGRIIPAYTSVEESKTFDTRNPDHQKIFDEMFFRKYGNGAPLSENGVPDWTDAEDFVEFFEDENLDFHAVRIQEPQGDVSLAVIDKTKLRSINAAFDPDFKESADLLAQRDEKQEPRGYYEPENTLIRLTETSNLSTFLHEFAHFMYEMELKGDTDSIKSIHSWYKRNSKAVAKEAKNDVSEIDVYQFLDNGTTGDKTKDEAVRKAVHEQFARGFETYLMEGKAPSAELKDAFRTFARWLAQVYENLKGNLNVKLDDEAREFFDRLIATEEQIAEAQGRARVAPLFTDATMAGMTEEAFVKYQDDQTKSTDKQVETLRDKLIKQIVRKTEKWWKEERDDLIEDEVNTLKSTRVYNARDKLKAVVSTEALEPKLDFANKSITDAEKAIKKLKKTNDTIGQYIAKNGGLSRSDMQSQGVDPAEFKRKSKVFGKPLFPKKGGMTADALGEKLSEEFGREIDANDALEIIFNTLESDEKYIKPDTGVMIRELESKIDDSQERIEDISQRILLANIKLDHDEVKIMVGEDRVNKLGRKQRLIPSKLRGMTDTKGGGINPDDAAALLGYESGMEMISDLIEAPTIKDAATANAQRRMIERHGDILNDGTIQREADDAVQDESRAKLMINELKVLSKNTSVPVIDRKSIKDQASQRIGGLTFREIFPAKYRRAEIKAAQEAVKLLANGDKEGAARAKVRQVVNFYLESEAVKAKAETIKIVDSMSRYNKKSVREAIQKAGGGHFDQIEKILARFEFRKFASLKDVESLNLWVLNRSEQDGDGLILTGDVLDESYVSHWKNVPFSNLQGINSSVKNIEYVAKYASKIMREQGEVDFNNMIGSLVAHINASHDDKIKPAEAIDITKDRKGVAWATSQMTKIPWLVRELDGGEAVGIVHDAIMQPVNDASHAELSMFDGTLKTIYEMLDKRNNKDRKRHNSTLYIPELEGTKTGTKLRGHQVLAVALNTGNRSNLEKMLIGEGWAATPKEVDFNNPKLQAILAHMSKSDVDFVQEVWDQMETLYPGLSEVHRRTTGQIPPKVESTPVSFKTTDGGIIEVAGGYYPLKEDPLRSRRARENETRAEESVLSLFTNGASIQSSVNAGATNERTKVYYPIKLSLEVVPEHFQEVIHFITHHDAVRQANMIIRNPDFESAAVAAVGQEEFNQLAPWLNDVAKAGKNAQNKTFIDAAFGQLRMGTTLGIMGFKVSTGLIQTLGVAQTFSEVGSKHTFEGYKISINNGLITRSLRSLLRSEKSLQSGMDFALERSKVMPHRVKTMDREMTNVFNEIGKSVDIKGETTGLASGATNVIKAIGRNRLLRKTQEVSMLHIALIQLYSVDLPAWHAAYSKGVAEWNDESRAERYADWVVENTQGSGSMKDMAQLMRNQGKMHTSFTMFMTFFSTFWNIMRGLSRDIKKGRIKPSAVAAKIAFLFFLPTLMEMFVRGELEPEKDEDEFDVLQRYLLKTALYPAQSIPFYRDIANGVTSDYGYTMNPVAGVLERGIEGGHGMIGAMLDDDKEISLYQIKGISKLIAASLGVPGINQVWATGEHLNEVINEGEEATLRELSFGPKRD